MRKYVILLTKIALALSLAMCAQGVQDSPGIMFMFGFVIGLLLR